MRTVRAVTSPLRQLYIVVSDVFNDLLGTWFLAHDKSTFVFVGLDFWPAFFRLGGTFLCWPILHSRFCTEGIVFTWFGFNTWFWWIWTRVEDDVSIKGVSSHFLCSEYFNASIFWAMTKPLHAEKKIDTKRSFDIKSFTKYL